MNQLTDGEIVELYWQRSEQAIAMTQISYGKYLYRISENVLHNLEDAEENVNDTYLKAWNAMPDARPRALSAFLGKLCRNGAIDLYRKRHSAKREGSGYEACLEELSEVVSGGVDPEAESMAGELSDAINTYLRRLDTKRRIVFLGRYFYMDSVKEIAAYSGFSEANVKSILFRVRTDLAKYLKEEGYAL